VWLASSDARASETSISSCVRFLDWRKAMRFSSGALATEGSCRTGPLISDMVELCDYHRAHTRDGRRDKILANHVESCRGVQRTGEEG